MANFFPTLTILPTFPLDEEYEDSIIRSSYEGGYELTRPKFTRIRASFMVNYDLLPTADKNTLVTFVNVTVYGGASSFVWLNPQSLGTHTVRFAETPKYSYKQDDFWSTSFKLREI